MKFALVAALVLALSCSGSDSPTDPSDQPFNAPYGQVVPLSSDLRVTFAELLEESRCPSSVQCPWEGNARIRLEVSRGSQTASVILNTHGSTGYPREAEALGYRFSLEELVPYPAIPGQPNPAQYIARLTISRV